MEAVVRRHQGEHLFGIGFISLLAAIYLVPLGIYVWYCAHRDLVEMNAGRIDEAGRDLTRLARVLGIISTLIAAFMIFVVFVSVVSFMPVNGLHATRVVEIGR